MKQQGVLSSWRVFLVLGVAAWTGIAVADEHKIDLEFAIGSQERTCDEENNCVPWSSELSTYEEELHPVVPVKLVRFLLKPGEVLENVAINHAATEQIEYVARLAPRQKPFSLPRDPRRGLPRYVGGAYPRAWMGTPVVQEFRGYKIVEVQIFPLRMIRRGRAQFINNATLTINTKALEDTGENYRGLQRDLADINEFVDNPAPVPAGLKEEAPGYLIVGPRALIGTSDATPLQGLIEEKQSRGLQVTLAALEDVSASKDPKQIRDFIRAKYNELGIDYVLLVGDKAKLPWRNLKSGVNGNGDPIPSDQYYACLDGDFSNTSTYDWSCEVAVGRVGATTPEQVQAWVTKTLALQATAKAGQIRSTLAYGEKLDDSTLGGWSLDALVAGSNRTIPTVPFPETITTQKLYDTFQASQSATKFIQTLGEGGYHIVNHLGHANNTYVFRMNASAIGNLPNVPGFFYSQGCYPNNPDTNNWTIQATRATNIGPAAMISNTRYGWYAPGKGNEGTSALLHRAFWSMLFKDNVRQIGKMNHRAKEMVVAVQRSSLMRYTALESNLIGDPELDLNLTE